MAFRSDQRRWRHWWYAPATILAVSLTTVFTAGTSGAVVSGSPSGFESSDGNMTVEGTNAADWNCFANSPTPNGFATNINVGAGSCSTALAPQNAVAIHPDANNGTAGEVTWTSGQKLDNPCPSLTNNGSVPNKDDFTGVASYNEVNNTTTPPSVLLYGAEIRQVANGNSSANLELDQAQGPAGNCTSPIVRTAGDRLLAFDFTGGGTTLNFHAVTWITPASPNLGGNNGTCLISHNNPPCWGANIITAGSGNGTVTVGGCGSNGTTVEGCSNQSEILPANNGIDRTDLVSQRFAEFGVNLTKVLGLTGCSPFTQEVWESRTSGSSFTSNPEDIEIEHHTISNCGEVKIIKHTEPGGINQPFSFNSTLSGSELTCTQSAPTSFTLNDGSALPAGSNTQDCTNVPVGSYTVTEGAEPTGFAFDGLSCTATGTGSGHQDGTTSTQADITIAAGGDTVTCTYLNKQQLGAIKITKTSTKTTNPLAGATFSITGPNSYSNSVTTAGSSGSVCVDGLPFGTYHVTETAAPTGYAIDTTATQDVPVTANAKCSDSTFVGSSIAFTDTPLAAYQVNFKDGGSHTTSAVISCDNATNGDSSTTPASGWDTSLTRTNVKVSGTFTVTCTITIDP